MQLFHIALIVAIIGFVYEQDAPPVKLKIKKETDRAADIFPYSLPTLLNITRISWEQGYLTEFPAYMVAYEPFISDTFFYIFPPKDCGAVWLCFLPHQQPYINYSFANACDNSLRFNALEQVVYTYYKNDSGTLKKAYPFWSNMLLIKVVSSEQILSIKASKTNETYNMTVTRRAYFFQPYEDFKQDGEDEYEIRLKKEMVPLDMEFRTTLLLSSSPYCKAIAVQPFKGAVPGDRLLFMPADAMSKVLKTGREVNAKPSPYFLTGTKAGSQRRARVWSKHRTRSFDDPDKRTKLILASEDCCPLPWEFEGFLRDWKHKDHITYHRYTLLKDTREECRRTTGSSSLLQSILLELGPVCQWVRICFDVKEDKMEKLDHFCEDDTNTLSFIFVHGVYIPTDSDEARPLGLEYEELDTIRINFLLGSRGIEVAYGFADYLTPTVRDLMQLDLYDGIDPSNLQINLVRAPKCRARLLNDLGSTNIRTGQEARFQCLSIKDCECLQVKREKKKKPKKKT
nr:unnamed protein product [Haemonchus contortus]